MANRTTWIAAFALVSLVACKDAPDAAVGDAGAAVDEAPPPPSALPKPDADQGDPYPAVLERRGDGLPVPAPYLPKAPMPDLIGDGLGLPPPPRLELPPAPEAGSSGAADAQERLPADPAYEDGS